MAVRMELFFCSTTLSNMSSMQLIPIVAVDYRVVHNKPTPVSSFKFVGSIMV